MINIYLAARYTRRIELCGYRQQLRALGFRVDARWLDGSHQLDNAGTPISDTGESLVEDGDGQRAEALRNKFATDDFEDVCAADELVAFTEIPRVGNSRGGRHVELGIALGMGKPVTIVGPRENIFCWLPGIEHYDIWQDFLTALVDR